MINGSTDVMTQTEQYKPSISDDLGVTDNLRISGIQDVADPKTVIEEHPVPPSVAQLVTRTRAEVHAILHGQDDRVVVIVGPCSIHDPVAALDYGARLEVLRQNYSNDLLIIMRGYFEKPRTTDGWKGMINDPDLDGSFNINKGLRLARKLLLDLNLAGVPAGTEYLDLLTPQYIADLISWGAIGARTTESQLHRELASGLSCPVGFKNGTDGNLKIAIDAVGAAAHPHHFLTVTKAGYLGIFETSGNEDGHVILRGGQSPNYDSESINAAAQMLESAGRSPILMVDFSHANSGKQHRGQIAVGANVSSQLAGGENRVVGVMIESHIVEGRQDVVTGGNLVYGQSITDACLGWDDTVQVIEQLAAAVDTRRSLSR
jgi:3-deoxy-7-phosphoheptulonate synthase